MDLDVTDHIQVGAKETPKTIEHKIKSSLFFFLFGPAATPSLQGTKCTLFLLFFKLEAYREREKMIIQINDSHSGKDNNIT